LTSTVQYRQPGGSTWTVLGTMPAGSDLQVIAPATPSPDGAKISDTTSILTDDAGNRWKLAAGAPPQGDIVQWQPAGTTGFKAAGYSANVAVLEKWQAGAYQANTDGHWWSSDTSSGNVAWVAAPNGSPSGPTPPAGAVYQVGPAGIVAPNGAAFRANGINVLYRQVWGNGQVDIGRITGAKLKQGFGAAFNFVRFADLYTYGLDSAAHPATDATVRNWIADLTGHGIVVYAEVHYTGNAATGQALTDACTWLAEWGTFAKDNPLIWLGAQNEPHGDPRTISAMMASMYHAARNTGFAGPFGLCTGNPGNEIQGMNPADFANMDNAFFDPHYYGWLPSNGISYAALCEQHAAFHNRQGQMACLCLETGDATDGNNRDANWQDVLRQAFGNRDGAAAWMDNWNDGGADRLFASPYDATALTDYGMFVKGLMH
jgi:Cellulase (glycosyl hydrolase family 5)